MRAVDVLIRGGWRIWISVLIIVFDQEPGITAFVFALDADKSEFSAQLFSVERNFKISLFNLFRNRLVAERSVGTAVPDLDSASAVVAFGNLALEGGVGDGMIFYHHREPLVGGIQAGAFWHGPGFQYSICFETKVVVET